MIAHSVADPFYYLHNFRQVLEWIEVRYPDLLDAQELAFIEQFRGLPMAAQALLVRMVMRKGVLFRASKLAYAEIGATQAALVPLVAQGWVDDQCPLSLAQLFQVLRKDEISLCFADRLARPRAAKGELFEQLQAGCTEVQPLHLWWPTFSEPVYALRLQAMCDRFRLLFFGNLYQDWSEFVLSDLGLLRYEQVAFSDDSRALRTRGDVDICMALHGAAEQLAAGAPVVLVLAGLDGLETQNAWLERRRDRLLFQFGQQCERLGDWPLALSLYPRTRHPQARERHIRVLERSGDYPAALALASAAEQAPGNAAEAQALARILPRLRRKQGGPVQPRRAAVAVNRLDLNLPQELAALGVEHAVKVHLEADDGPVHYVENTLFNSLFGLLCWEAIFAPLPGAFFHPFQSGPLDLHDAGFHARRSTLFAACLEQLDDGSYRQAILNTFTAKYGLQSPFVFWELLSAELLAQALDCLPAEHLKRCFERLLEDIQTNRAGMPDLIQFWPAQRRYRMIEVKGPGDRLQDNQLRWIEFCTAHGLPVDVCHVQWASPTP
ncbi:VRR-NUC domain-containing protein [Pseudomonas fontis]|uniref:phosphodiesterase I n=1 Tax=Pseudomonas fontis TaxID=2942633 RepID=A0ABT5NL72_9PSED|nr:VRR-NUC domain-containing protein [Pseudomonas fontis]MDD0976646.1 VRR-NUC domain-containing protein [Pseudomonas fontis]MDD0988994.1 VRR-NUC domain-containing protein [Pseudomonas fontis]